MDEEKQIGIVMASMGENNPYIAYRAANLFADCIQLSDPSYHLDSLPTKSDSEKNRLIEFIEKARNNHRAFDGAVPDVYSITCPNYTGNEDEWLDKVEYLSQFGVPIIAGHAAEKSKGYDLDVLKGALTKLAQKGQSFAIETGTEPVRDLLLVLDQLYSEGYENVGVSLDAANFGIYGTEKSADDVIDSMHEFDGRILQLHLKDADFNTHEERPLGEGDVRIKRYIEAAERANYSGPLIIEVGGPFAERYKEAVRAHENLEKILYK